MSLTFKLLSLVIRTAAKPVGNYIKRQAKEHDGFRRFAVRQAQYVHQIDMRMRLGLLHDAEAQQRMHEREQKAAEEKKRKTEKPTVRTEEEQKKYEEEQARAEKAGEKKEEKAPKIKIRPLSEAKAIELGANFFSEAFIFAVAAGLLVWDAWRTRRKESARRDVVAERLAELEAEVDRLRIQQQPALAEDLAAEREKAKLKEKEKSWWNPAGWWSRTEPVAAEGEEQGAIAGNVPGPDPEKAVKPNVAGEVQSKASQAAGNPTDVEPKSKGSKAPSPVEVQKSREAAETTGSSTSKPPPEAAKEAPERVLEVPAAKRGR